MSPGSARLRMVGLQHASVQWCPNGSGANPLSTEMMYAESFMKRVLMGTARPRRFAFAAEQSLDMNRVEMLRNSLTTTANEPNGIFFQRRFRSNLPTL